MILLSCLYLLIPGSMPTNPACGFRACVGFVLCAWLVRVGLSTFVVLKSRRALVALFVVALAFESLLDFFAGGGGR